MSKAKLFIETAPRPELLIKMRKATLENRSAKVWQFLDKRDLINIRGLCEKIGYDSGNFWRLMTAKKKMTQALLLKVEKELQLYGFN